jgi:hemolysin III
MSTTTRRAADHHLPHEERASALVHGLGFAAAVTALALLLVRASERPDDLAWLSALIFGLTMATVYLASTLYHLWPSEGRWKVRLERLDNAAIFLFIAGTYTPLAALGLDPELGNGLLATVWGIAALGVLTGLTLAGRFRLGTVLLAIAMGWCFVPVAEPLAERLAPEVWQAIVAGGAAYSGGTVFYLWRLVPFHHAVWHAFVVAGSSFHTWAIWHLIGSAPG